MTFTRLCRAIRHRVVVRFVVGVGIPLTFGLATMESAKPAPWVVRFTIDDYATGQVSSDAAGKPYVDYRLTSEPDVEADPCVDSGNDGSYIRLNRHMSSAPNEPITYCEDDGPGGDSRQFLLRIEHQAACSDMMNDPDIEVTTDATGCTLTWTRKPRITFSNLWGRKATSTTVNFFIAEQWRLSLSGEATISYPNPLDTNHRMVTWTGSAGLFGPNEVYGEVALPFQMTFKRLKP